MFSQRAERTIHLETRLSRSNVQQELGQRGHIRAIYGADLPGTTSLSQYFVEFSDVNAAADALSSPLRDTTSRALVADPHLVERFRVTVVPDLPPKPQAIVLESTRYSPYQNSKKLRSNKEKRRTKGMYPVVEPTSPMTILPHIRARQSRPTPASSTDVLPYRDSDKENRTPRATKTLWKELEAPQSDNSAYSRGLSIESQHPIPLSSTSDSLLERDASIYLVNRGELNPINLNGLDDSPDEIISALRAAAGHPLECAKWMMVGAHYRGTGNSSAAIAVVTAMIEVMLDVGMETSRLKPSLLMLSSCHMDMARRLRAEAGMETAESKYHYDTACDHLRTVYGSFVPPSVDAATYSHAACALLPPACPDDTQPMRRQRSPAASPAITALRGQSPDSTPRYSHVKVLEREIRSLRDRQADQAEALDHTRDLKRKVEDELETERQARRRLERQLDRAEKDAIGAEKSERVALEQCRAEVETRRWAEERAEDMRRVAVDTRAALEPRLAEYGDWEGKVKGFFGKMGIVFLKAARGEFGEVLNGRA